MNVKKREQDLGGKETLTQQITIRLASRDLARLEALSKRVPIASRNAIARSALQIGIASLEENPRRLIGEGNDAEKAR